MNNLLLSFVVRGNLAELSKFIDIVELAAVELATSLISFHWKSEDLYSESLFTYIEVSFDCIWFRPLATGFILFRRDRSD